MRVLVCVKRVPAPGAKINITADGLAVDTAYLAFTTSPHEECAVEEAVQLDTSFAMAWRKISVLLNNEDQDRPLSLIHI